MKMISFVVDEETKAYAEILKSKGWNLSAVLRKAIADKALEVSKEEV